MNELLRAGPVKGFSLLELLTVIAITGMVVGLLAPALVKGRRKSNDVHCKGNLRQLGIALRIYADENEGRLPSLANKQFRTNVFSRVQLLQELSPSVFHCREDRVREYRSSYDWNEAINDRLLHKVGSNEESPGTKESAALLQDRLEWHGHRNAAFSDGHVGVVKNERGV